MTFKEFLDYLEENVNGYEVFMVKATDFQQAINKKRQPAKRHNEQVVSNEAYKMWEEAMKVAYNNVKSATKNPKYDVKKKWFETMEQHNLIESLNEGISELEFE